MAVASLGALSRFAQMFLLLAQMNPLLIEPYFAKLPRTSLKRNYVLVLAAAGSVCVFVSGLAARFPELYLWVLGQKYNGLRFEILLVVLGSSIYYLAGRHVDYSLFPEVCLLVEQQCHHLCYSCYRNFLHT